MDHLALIAAAAALNAKLHDPLLMDAIRVLASKNQPEPLTRQAEAVAKSCLDAWFVLYGTDGIPSPDENRD